MQLLGPFCFLFVKVEKLDQGTRMKEFSLLVGCFWLAMLTSWGPHRLVMRKERAETKYILCQQV